MITLFVFSLCFYIFAFLLSSLKLNTNVQIFNTLIPLFIISGFRYNVGYDFTSYTDYFYQIQNNTEVYLDSTFKFLSKISYLAGGNEQFVFIVYSALTIYLIYKIISYITLNYGVQDKKLFILGLIYSFYSFYFFLSLNQIRSSLSALFLCYAFIQDRKSCSSFLCFLLAFMFHSASVFLVPIYYLIKRANIKLLVVLFPIFASLSYMNVLSELIKIVLQLTDSRFAIYFNSEFFSPKIGLEKIYTLITTCVTMLILGVSILMLQQKYNVLLRLVYCFIILRLMSMDALIFARLSDFLKPVTLIVIFATIYVISNKFKQNFILPCFFALTLFVTLFNVYLGSNISQDPEYKYYFNFCVVGKVCPL